MFLVDTFAGLTAPIAFKQCQLIIGFATNLLACHAGVVITLWVCAAKPSQAKAENRALVALRSAARASYVTKPACSGHLAV